MNKELHILILEDRAADAELMMRELRREGIQFNAKRVWTEPDFLATLRTTVLDLILADYALPAYDGLSALKVAEKECPQVPFIFVSGSLGEEKAIDALHHGATDYVLKQKIERLGPAVRRALREVEERKRRTHAEEELRRSERNYRKLFDAATEGIALADAETGEILDCNRAFLQLGGFDRSDVIGRPQSLLHPKENGNPAVSRTFALHRGEKEGAALPTALVTKSGAVRQVEVKANVLEIDGRKVLQGFFRDITAELRYHRERETTLKLLHVLNQHSDTHILIRELTGFLQEWTGCEAVGVRLLDGEDFPYFETRGFPREFVRVENSLCGRDERGQLARDSQGNPILECMCGNVLCGRFNPALPFFTSKGSFWTNNTTELLASTTEADRQARTRNRCNGEGYESVALFALRQGSKTLGLLQINDRAKGRFTPDLITFLENAADQIAIALAQRQSQAALRLSEQRFAVFMEHLPAVVFIKDLQNRFVFTNRYLQELHGQQDHVGKGSPNLWPPPSAQAMEEHDSNVLAQGPAVIEERVLDCHGVEHVFETHKFPIKVNEVPVWLGGIAVDITARKHAEEQIRAQASLLDLTRDAIMVQDLDNHILYWNKGAERLYGWPSGEAKPLKISELYQPETAEFIAAREHLLATAEWAGELRQTTRDGREITVSSRWTLVRDGGGQPESVLVINTDITEKKKLEAQFLRAQRLESIGSLASGIAHDINNILSPIMMTMPLVRTEVASPGGQRLLDAVEDCAKRGADIVRQLLTFGRGTLENQKTVNPRHFLDELYNIIKETFPKNIQSKVSCPKDLWSVKSDPTQLHQALLNLCVNARDAMPNGGLLHLQAENLVLDEAFVQMCPEAKEGPHVVLSIADTGSGIPQEILNKIFDPFFTTKEPGKGTGLGLATVQKIAQNHGGFVLVRTDLGKGTEFRLFLPAASEPAAPAQFASHAALPRGRGELILVVDDEPSILTITGSLLEKYNYRVLAAKDGTDAIGQFALHRDEVQLVLTDFMMPILDGLSTIRALRNIEPNLKAVLMTGWDDPGKQPPTSGLNPLVFLRKPFTAAALLRLLSEALRPTQGHSF